MDRIAQMVSNRLSLRPPQKQSLEILNNLTDKLELQKEIDLDSDPRTKGKIPLWRIAF